MKILLIAKPWKGGLGRYYHQALESMFPDQVEWISTRPSSLADYLAFRRDAKGWWARRQDKIATTACDAALFIGYRKEFRSLPHNPHHVMYLVDAVSPAPDMLNAFGRVFLSDAGYIPELAQAVDAVRIGGVVPFAFHPAVHCPVTAAHTQKDVCFIGNRDGKRDAYLARLMQEKLTSTIVGNYFLRDPLFWKMVWKKPAAFCPAVDNDTMAAIYARHKVSLNIHAQVVREGTNMRTFECAGYRIPQVVEYRQHLEDYFDCTHEIMTYRTEDEMVAQLDRVVRDDACAQGLAERAHRRALAEHTYFHRVAQLLQHVIAPQDLRVALSRVLVGRE